ncbi:MAG: hypothetical protein WBF75_00235 [Pseudonocardiaceae bacterium]
MDTARKADTAGLRSALANPRRAQAGATPRATDLLPRVSGGDSRAWEGIVRRYSGVVRATVRSYLLPDKDARDAAQMTGRRLTENVHQVQSPEQLTRQG